MHTVQTVNTGPSTRTRLVVDEDYQTVGSYGFDTPEETEAAEQEEIKALNNGDLVVLGAITEKLCPACGAWEVVDSLWGIVVDNSDAGYEEALAML